MLSSLNERAAILKMVMRMLMKMKIEKKILMWVFFVLGSVVARAEQSVIPASSAMPMLRSVTPACSMGNCGPSYYPVPINNGGCGGYGHTCGGGYPYPMSRMPYPQYGYPSYRSSGSSFSLGLSFGGGGLGRRGRCGRRRRCGGRSFSLFLSFSRFNSQASYPRYY